MTVTKQQQLEWLAKEFSEWPGFAGVGIRMGNLVIGEHGGEHIITREEWQQERDKMQKQGEKDNSWHERGEFPPAGCECDFCNSDDEWSDWHKCVFVGFDSAGNGVVSVFGDDKGLLWLTNNPSDFRPLRTEREKAIDEMLSVIPSVVNEKHHIQVFGLLYDAGYRKVKP